MNNRCSYAYKKVLFTLNYQQDRNITYEVKFSKILNF